MASDSPFFLTKVECPICRTINEFETVKLGAYVEDGRDTDFCPRNIKWRFPRYQAYNPLAFFTATCSHCFYTREFNNVFKDWKDDNNFRTYRLKTIKERHLVHLATADSVLRKIADAVNLKLYPNETAILKLHLAAFDELLTDHPNTLDLGRFYLRIGWVFRSMDGSENPSLSLLKAMLLEIDNQSRVLGRVIANCRTSLDLLTRQLDAHFDNCELSAEVKATMLPHRDAFNSEGAAMEQFVTGMEDRHRALSGLLTEYRSTMLGGASVERAPTFTSYPSFTDFLLSLKEQWEGVVVNEHEALTKAALYYKEAFAEGRGIAPGAQQIQASYLIGELSHRIGDFDTAREYFNSTIKHGQEFIYRNRDDKSRTVLARKILELAIEQGKVNMAALKATPA